jgi:hypothetical protein
LKLHVNIWEAATFVLLLVTLGVLVAKTWDYDDLRCRVARMETLAVSADPLPDCEEETHSVKQDRGSDPVSRGGVPTRP